MNQVSMDPNDWGELEKLGKKMVEDMMQFFEQIHEKPVWQEAPNEVKQFLKTPVPQVGKGEGEVYQLFQEKILPYALLNAHPRFWGWVVGTGFPFAMLSDMLASGVNTVGGIFNHTGNLVEQQVVNWLKDIMGYPQESSGLMVSGGSMSNFVGLNVARDTKAAEMGIDIRQVGVAGLPKPLIFYVSAEAHNSIDRAIQMLGLGRNALRKIKSNQDFQIDLEALEDQIKKDSEDGLQPACLIGCVGTTGIGAIDDLEGLHKLSQKYKLWFHIDGTFGSLLALSKKYRHRVKGLELSDSITFDLHKWMYIPYEAAMILVKNKEAHLKTFSMRHDYLDTFNSGIASGEWLYDYGPQTSRRFNALKVWMSIQAYGIEKFGQMIEKDMELIEYLKEKIEKHPDLEHLAPAPLNIVNFRYKKEGLSEAELNQLNLKILQTLQNTGFAMPSNKNIKGKEAIRVAMTNHRCQKEDIDQLLEETLRLGGELKN